MAVHPRRAVMELFHLKRVHVLCPNDTLGEAIKQKLSTLQIPSDQLTEKSLECLLDCLAYFGLPAVPAAVVAVDKAHALLPQLKGRSLASILRNCAQLEEHSVALSSVPLLVEAIRTMSSEDVAGLCTALSRAGLNSPEKWTFLAEHVLRNVTKFSGSDLLQVVSSLGMQKIDYPDFFAVVERHVCDQPQDYMTSAELAELIGWFKKGNFPVVSLLALSSDRTALGLESGIDAVGAHFGGEVNGKVLSSFLSSSEAVLGGADLNGITETLIKCDSKKVFHVRLLLAALQRAATVTSEVAGSSGGEKAQSPSSVFECVQASLLVAKGHHSSNKKQTEAGEPMEAWRQCGALILTLFDYLTPMVGSQSSKIISTVFTYVQLFGKPKEECALARCLVEHFQRTDSVEAMEPNQMTRFCQVMFYFSNFGGLDVISKHMSVFTLASNRMSPQSLCILADIISHCRVKANETGALNGIFQAVLAAKNWRRVMKPDEVLKLLDAMTRSRNRHNGLLLELVSIVLQCHSLFTPQELSTAALAIATLNYKELDFFTITATRVYLSPQCTIADVCRMLYTLTHVVSYVIRAVQDALPKLRIAASQAAPRDITLAFYSFAKLKITKHEDVVKALCDQAVATSGSFKPKEILSVLQSLRHMNVHHAHLVDTFAARVVRDRQHFPPDVYTSITATLAASGKTTFFDHASQRDFVSSTLRALPTINASLLRDALVAISNFHKAFVLSKKGIICSAPILLEGEIVELDLAARSKADAMPGVEGLCDCVVALTDIGVYIDSSHPLAVRLQNHAMELMELPNYQLQFRQRGLYRLFPQSNTSAHRSTATTAVPVPPTTGGGLQAQGGASTTEPSSLGAVSDPLNGGDTTEALTVAPPTHAHGNETDVGAQLRQYHDAKKMKAKLGLKRRLPKLKEIKKGM